MTADDQRPPEDRPEKTPTNPLKLAWLGLTTLGSIAALSNMIKDIVQWKGIILTTLETYESFTYPIFDFAFAVLWLSIPNWIYDYLVFGLINSTSLFKGHRFLGVLLFRTSLNYLGLCEQQRYIMAVNRVLINLAFLVFVFLYASILWPAILLYTIAAATGSIEQPEFARLEKMASLRWLGCLMLTVLVLMLFNQLIKAWGAA